MQRRSHPFFSGIGCGAALLLALALAAIISLRGGAPFSPGRLSAAQSPGRAALVQSDSENHAAFENECEQCHAPWRGVTAERCENCHVNVGEQRASGGGLHGQLPDTGRCQACHSDHGGRDATLTTISTAIFDHEQTAFSLARHETDYDGAPLACAGCHVSGGYTAATVDCATCHADAAPDFMAEHSARFGDDCLACHDGRDTMATFDHAAVFPLDGAHATVDCAACHEARTFAGTPRECVGCHEEPAIHAGLFGADCARCHSTTAWTPAELTRHTFPLDHGDAGKQDCQTCHEASYTAYTCYNCHEHDPAGTRAEHLEEGISDFEDCVECHPTGREDEAEEAHDE